MRPSPPVARRTFLAQAGLLAAGALLPRAAGSVVPGDDATTISVLHTADLHGHIVPYSPGPGETPVGGMARCASQIRLWRRENPHTLLLDLGDLYQGTPVGFATRGQVMVEILNALGYDGWVVGNHEFDWGAEAFVAAAQQARCPLLAANLRASPVDLGAARIAPTLLREVAGYRIGIVGLTTPGLPFWLNRRQLGPYAAVDPVEPCRLAIRALRDEKADAILIAAHMGWRREGDDYANRVVSLTREFPDVAAVIGAHTHRNFPVQLSHRVVYTQANHHGIHIGRVDLTFENGSRRLVNVAPRTVRMDDLYDPDPAVLALAGPALSTAAEQVARPIGTLARPLEPGAAGEGGGFERLVAAALQESLASRGVAVDAVLHGSFVRSPIAAGPKTWRDAWSWLPYDNSATTVTLTRHELLEVLNDNAGLPPEERRALVGLRAVTAAGAERAITEVLDTEGKPLRDDRAYLIAVNSYDGQSGGRKLMVLRAFGERRSAALTDHGFLIRDSVVDLFQRRGTVEV